MGKQLLPLPTDKLICLTAISLGKHARTLLHALTEVGISHVLSLSLSLALSLSCSASVNIHTRTYIHSIPKPLMYTHPHKHTHTHTHAPRMLCIGQMTQTTLVFR